MECVMWLKKNKERKRDPFVSTRCFHCLYEVINIWMDVDNNAFYLFIFYFFLRKGYEDFGV